MDGVITWIIVMIIVVGGVPIAVIIAFSSSGKYKMIISPLQRYTGQIGEGMSDRIDKRRKQGIAHNFMEQKRQAGTRRRAAYQASLFQHGWKERQKMRVTQPLERVRTAAGGVGSMGQGNMRSGGQQILRAFQSAGSQDTAAAQAAFSNLQTDEAKKSIQNLDIKHMQALVQANGNLEEAINRLIANGELNADSSGNVIRDGKLQSFMTTFDEVQRRGINVRTGAAAQAVGQAAAEQGSVLVGGTRGRHTSESYLQTLENHQGIAAAERGQVSFTTMLKASSGGQMSVRPGRVKTLGAVSVGDINNTVEAMLKQMDDATGPAKQAHIDNLVNTFAEAQFAQDAGKLNVDQINRIKEAREMVGARLQQRGHMTSADWDTRVNSHVGTVNRTAGT